MVIIKRQKELHRVRDPHPRPQSRRLSSSPHSEHRFPHPSPEGAGVARGPASVPPAGAARSGLGHPEGPRLRSRPRPAQPGCPEPRTRQRRPQRGRYAPRWRWRDAGPHGGRRAPRLRAQDQQVARPLGPLPVTPRARAPPRGCPALLCLGAPHSSPFRLL